MEHSAACKLGDLAAIKLLFQYVLGKPAATVNPDALDVDEVDLYRRAPLHRELGEIVTERMSADVGVACTKRTIARRSGGRHPQSTSPTTRELRDRR